MHIQQFSLHAEHDFSDYFAYADTCTGRVSIFKICGRSSHATATLQFAKSAFSFVHY